MYREAIKIIKMNPILGVGPGSHIFSRRYRNLTGREIAILVNETKSSGNYSVIFDGSNLNSGFYFYQIIAGDYQETKKMSLLK